MQFFHEAPLLVPICPQLERCPQHRARYLACGSTDRLARHMSNDELVDPILASRDLADFGFSRRNTDKLLRDGDWHRLRHGTVQIGEPMLRSEDQHRLLVKATVRQWRSRSPMAISHASAAVLWGLPVWGVDLGKVHLTRPGRPGLATTAHVVPHRSILTDGEITELHGIPVTTMARTVLDMARYHGFTRGVVVADAALRSGLDPVELNDVIDVARQRRTGGCAERVIAFADPLSESVGESRSRVALAVLGLPKPVLQQEFRSRSGGFVGRADFWMEDFATIGEFDGRSKYGLSGNPAIEDLAREKDREDELRDLGQQMVRWTDSVLGQPFVLVDRFRRAFARAGHSQWTPEPRPELAAPGSARRHRRR